jgi:lactose/raffinose/galactose permease
MGLHSNFYNHKILNGEKMKKQLATYSAGAFGHDVFYATLSTYFILFVTSQLFNSGNQAEDDKSIAMVTAMIAVLRIIELVIDPIIGGIIDKTETKWGKFKPWIFIGGLLGSICLILIFSDLGGLANSNRGLFIVIFAIIYIFMDIVYSFKDIGFWSMLPALSLGTRQREKIGTAARFGSQIGQAVVPLSIFTIITWFSSNKGTEGAVGDKQGWLAFAIIVAAVSFGTALITIFGTKEKQSNLRKQKENTSLLQVFKVLTKNNQLLWLALYYGLFALSYVITSQLVAYYFTYIFGDKDKFLLTGWMQMGLSILSVLSFPFLTRLFKGRRTLFFVCVLCMVIGFGVFVFAGTNLTMILIAYGLFFFPYPIVFLITLMIISDCVEYGQWKNGTRAEGVTLSIRPLLDKLAGAVANAVVGATAVWCSMTNDATATSVAAHPQNIANFKIMMFGIPLALLIISTFVFFKKVTLDEKTHEKIVVELEGRLGKDSEEQ